MQNHWQQHMNQADKIPVLSISHPWVHFGSLCTFAFVGLVFWLCKLFFCADFWRIVMETLLQNSYCPTSVSARENLKHEILPQLATTLNCAPHLGRGTCVQNWYKYTLKLGVIWDEQSLGSNSKLSSSSPSLIGRFSRLLSTFWREESSSILRTIFRRQAHEFNLMYFMHPGCSLKIWRHGQQIFLDGVVTGFTPPKVVIWSSSYLRMVMGLRWAVLGYLSQSWWPLLYV